MFRSRAVLRLRLALPNRVLVFSSTLLLAIGTSVILFRAAAAAQLFTAPFASYAAPSYPLCVAVGDLNGDGNPDLAVGSSSPIMASVLLGNGDGTFGGATTIATGGGTHSIAIEDLDGDGDHDLLLANATENTVNALRGNGDGAFLAVGAYVTGGGPVSLAVSDLNGDGIGDLATANVRSSTVSVWLGQGDCMFGARTDFVTGDPPVDIVVGDLNGDGIPDLVTANGESATISILLGNGDGAFGPSGGYDIGAGPQSLAIGDVNGDGNLDLATVNTHANTVSVLLGNGDGTFQRTSYATSTRPADIAIGDMNADGRPDLVLTSNFSGLPATPPIVSVLLGDGAGGFGARTDFQTAPGPGQLALGDLNRDGSLDLAVVSYGANLVTPMLGHGDGTFDVALTFPAGARPRAVVARDLNSDGRLDLAVANDVYGNGTVSVLLGNGAGAFQMTSSIVTGNNPHSVAIGDLNEDGKPDLAVANYLSHAVSVLLGNGDGTFGAKTDYSTGSYPASVVIGDLNGDGRPDLAVANYFAIPSDYTRSTLSVLLGNGDGTFGTKTDFDTRGQPYSLAIGDLNRDGSLDLAMGHYEPGDQVSVFLGNGDGTFGPYVNYQTGLHPEFVTLGNLNEDGVLDLVAVCKGSGAVSVLLGNGDGTFRASTDFGLGPLLDFGLAAYPLSAAIGDANGDGKSDLAVSNAGGNRVSVFLGNGDGTYAGRTDYATAFYPASVVMGDLNGDGRPDLAAACYFSNAVAVSFNIGDLPTAIAVSLASSAASPNHASLTWYSSGGDASATVYRRTELSNWQALGTISADGMRFMHFTDRDVTPGTRYGYQLGIVEHGSESLHGETWLMIPTRSKLALHGLWPNPSGPSGSVVFSLPDDGAAHLELFDVRGRRVLDQQVGSLGPGKHVLGLDTGARLRAGLYLIRLTHRDRSLTARGVIVR